MPKGTPVDDMYRAILRDLLRKGVSPEEAKAKAARIAQAKTGLALATGRPPKRV